MSAYRKHILFVCTGNTCRSPMAQQLLLRLARAAGLSLTASSAGLGAPPGAPIAPLAQAVLATRGIGRVRHQARALGPGDVKRAGVIYTMTHAQREKLLLVYPEAGSKTYILRQAAGLAPADIEDPAGGSQSAYERAAASIEEALRIIVKREPHD